MIRHPAVAGTFYPEGKEKLHSLIENYLREAKKVKYKGELKAIIVPHAGYMYSGIVAAAGFKLLKGKKFKKVFLLGPSHHVYFEGVSLSQKDFSTPLGLVKCGQNKSLLQEKYIFNLPEAHFQEHCLEVELPFLQEILPYFEIYPFVLGEINEKEFAKIIAKYLDQETLIIVSSDLSHYLPYEKAVNKDQQTIKNIREFNFTGLDACGSSAIKVLMHLAKELSWNVFLVDYRNSGDTAGNKSQVVGYAAIGYIK